MKKVEVLTVGFQKQTLPVGQSVVGKCTKTTYPNNMKSIVYFWETETIDCKSIEKLVLHIYGQACGKINCRSYNTLLVIISIPLTDHS